MASFQHDFHDIKDYLHHRPPYLLIDTIVEITELTITTAATVGRDDFYTKAHFPGAPILPGAMMQEMTTQSAGVLIAARHNPMSEFDTHDPFANEFALGVLVKIRSARFKSFARPGDRLRIEVVIEDKLEPAFDFRATIYRDQQKLMENRFQLMNVPSRQLMGTTNSDA